MKLDQKRESNRTRQFEEAGRHRDFDKFLFLRIATTVKT